MTQEEKEKKFDLESKMDEMLIQKRIIILSAPVDDDSAYSIVRRFLYLETLNSKKPILFIVNSPGGSIHSGFVMWDHMQQIKAPVFTLATGLAASMGSILILAAKQGNRFATHHARIMIHQPLINRSVYGQATDLEIQAKEIIKTRELLIDLYREKTGKDRPSIEKALDRDTWMSATEAKAFNLVDHIISSYEEIGF